MNRIGTTLASATFFCFASAAVAMPAVGMFVDDDDEAEEAEAPEEDTDDYLLLRGGDVYTGTGGVLRGADLLVKNGVIEAIGNEFYVPDEAEIFDVRGLRLYPGLVALSASSRITQGSFAPAEDLDEPGYDPALDAAGDDEWDFDALELAGDFAPDDAATRTVDTYDPFSTYLALALANGITTIEQSGAAIKLKRFTIDDVVLRDDYLSSLSFGSPDARRGLRKDFAAARGYLNAMREWRANDEEGEEPSKRGVNATVLSVLEGDTRAKFNANDREDLLGIARLAQDYGFRPVIDGCREGWIVADELGRAGATAIINARDRRWKPDLQVAEGGSSIENAAKLHQAGVQVAIKPLSGSVDLGGIAGRDLLALTIEAGFAVRGGLSDQAALESITMVPARVMGVDHRVGSLEVGKDADILITDGDILHYETFVQYAVVAGEMAYDKSDELFYAHIRPQPEREMVSEDGDDEVSESDEADDEADESEDGEAPDEEEDGDDDEDDDSDEG